MSAHILIIEDNQANLELMVYLLKAFGFQVTFAENGQAGINSAQTAKPDLIICDIQLPVFDGYEVARQLKLQPALRDIPIIAVTAFAMAGDRQKILTAGFNGYLTKPIEPELFVSQISAFLPANKAVTAT